MGQNDMETLPVKKVEPSIEQKKQNKPLMETKKLVQQKPKPDVDHYSIETVAADLSSMKSIIGDASDLDLDKQTKIEEAKIKKDREEKEKQKKLEE